MPGAESIEFRPLAPEEMPLQAPDVPAADADRLRGALFAAGAPEGIVDQVFDLSRRFGPELLTAVLGMMGIHMINSGSSRYADLRPGMPDEEKRTVVRDASGKVLGGTAALATVAFASGNPLFAIPEVAAMLTSLRPYLDSRFPKIAAVSSRIRADLILAGTAAATGIATTAAYANNAWEALPPAGLSAISAAFAIGGQQAYEKLYRFLAISGGSALVVGSAHAMSEAVRQNNGVGAVMAAVFLALNAVFTKNEISEAMKMPNR